MLNTDKWLGMCLKTCAVLFTFGMYWLVVLLFSTSCLAQTVDNKYLLINGKSFHLDHPDTYNERNWGLGLEMSSRAGRITTGYTGAFLIDSYSKPSAYIGGLWKYRVIDRAIGVDIGAIAGLMVRDNIRNYTPFPFVLPAASVSYGRVHLNITLIPNLPAINKDGAVVFLQLGWRL